MPKRIQRRRSKGWRMPEGAIYVGRPTIYGNPFVVGSPLRLSGLSLERYVEVEVRVADHHDVLLAYRIWLAGAKLDLDELRGHDLVCWCPLDQPCHADVLLELANR